MNWADYFRTRPKCPTPFRRINSDACVMRCPTQQKFEYRNDQGGMACVYRPDEQFKVSLVPVGTTVFNGNTLEDLQKENREEAADFLTEKDRFEKEIAVVYANIDKQQKIDDAFKDLQKAENARDQSPEAYQAARTAYYTLIKGAQWLNEERQRIANAEVLPEVKKYQDAVTAVNVRTQEQQKTIDIVNGIKDRVLSLRDDFRYSVNTFSDQLEKVKIQINMENRSRDKERDSTWAWIDVILNTLLIAALLYAVYTLASRYLFAKPATTTLPVNLQVPTYTGQRV